MPDPTTDLEQRLVQLAGKYRAEQLEHAAKAGYRGEHAEKSALLDRVVVDLEALLCGEDPPTDSEHATRQIRQRIAATNEAS